MAKAQTKQSETELLLEFQCGRCNFTINKTIDLDEDGVYTIPNKFCPNCFRGLDREIIKGERHLPKEVEDGSEDKVPHPVSRPIVKSDEEKAE